MILKSADTPQPTTYTLDRIPLPALFGSAEFADAEFGAAENPLIKTSSKKEREILVH